jgi:hypothetical protein
MSIAKFPVRGKLDSAGGDQEGSVLIDRGAGTFTVRPKGSRTVYTLPLAVVATWVCQQTLAAQVRTEKIAKKAARAARGA